MGRTAETIPAAPSPTSLHLPCPRPLFPPTTLIVGDSIVRDICFFNAVTRCVPGATVSDILTGLRRLLPTLPSSIRRIIVHVGTNDTALKRSEVTKSDFTDMLRFLNRSGRSVLISGPIPTLGRGSESFSRLLGLHSWLQSACKNFNVLYIDNFNLFWDRLVAF